MFRLRGWTLPRVGTGVLGLAALVVAMLVVPAIASAAASPSLTVESGSFRAGHGYVMSFYVDNCSAANTTATIDYAKGPVEYSYSGAATCTLNGGLKKGTLAVSWPGVATIDLHTGAVGRKAKGKAPKGCTGGGGSSRAAVLKGSLDITASKYFGHLKARKIVALLASLGNLKCNDHTAKSTDLTAFFGQDLYIDASKYKRTSEVFIEDTFAPAAGVTGNMFLDVTSKKLFKLSKTGGAVAGLKPFAKGTLKTTNLAACIGDTSGAVNTTLTGGLTLNMPVVGKLSLGPANATQAYIGPSLAVPEQCSGYGSVALTPSADNVCDQDGICSVQDGTNSDEFYDQSTDGTQTVVSETINFGDGNATVPFTEGMSHTYGAPGAYTATLTIETSNGQTQTTTTVAYIDK